MFSKLINCFLHYYLQTSERIKRYVLVLTLVEKVVSGSLLFTVLDRLIFIDSRSEVVGVTSERDLDVFQEQIHTVDQTSRWVGVGFDSWFTFENDGSA